MRSLYCSVTIIGITLISIIVASGCIFNSTPPASTANAANATADTMLQSLNDGDYRQFSANFSDAMKTGVNETSFEDLRGRIQAKYGKYESKALSQSYTSQGYNDFVYGCTFENGSITVRLVMNANDPRIVEGLWFPNGI